MPFEIDFEDPRIGFASAHFIIDHEKCGRLHGHNYFIKVNISGDINEQHMVLDYGVLKEELRKLVKPLDHKVLIPTNAEGGLLLIEEKGDSIEVKTGAKRYLLPMEDVFMLPIPATTAEELAKYFHQELQKIWPKFKIKVTIEEAPGAS
ncbi:MAG: 6-pyruvoyl tetrahydropterin synthase family protein, partial [Asgard group archaeon]|nr:6-pyruvoyl tetrahydropterin synthase family protein [Asgard group archaeon]